VTGIAALPDGRVLFVESATRVRMMSDAGLVAASALSTESRDVEFTELVVDPAFDRSGFVFVGTTERQRDGRRDFRVRRYRLVGEALGEGATLIGNLLFRGVHAPRFTVDDLGRLYVAMPGGSGARTDPYDGRVLRFAADGSVPKDQRGLSPIFADGFPVPLDLDWDGRAVWIVGLDDRSQSNAGRLPLDVEDHGWPRRLSGTGLELWPGLDVSAVDITASGNDPASPAFVVDTAHRLYQVTRRADDAVAQVELMSWPADTLPVDVAIGPHGSIHVVVKTANGAFAIVAVTPPR
jgi:glucose/arabinose dehydrogenase